MITHSHPTVGEARLRLFTLYADFPAGIRARHLAGQLGKLSGTECALASEMWKLDSVFPVGPIREMIIEAAAESDLLVIAASHMEVPDEELNAWLNSLVIGKTNRLFPGLLVGLLGDDEHEIVEAHWLVQRLQSFAGEARMNFIWQSADRDSLRNTRWLGDSFEKLLDWKRTVGI
jgi:hypothetical protein